MTEINQIRHITLTYDGTSLKMYHEGVLDTVEIATFDLSEETDAEFFGNAEYANSFAGTYNAVRVYTRALSENEIKANYDNDIARFGTINVKVE
jgi:hypothetical protein